MQVTRFVRQLGKELIDDDIADAGAMMAYYAILALFPMLVFVLSLSLVVLDASTVRQAVDMALETTPPSVRELIGARVDALIAASGAGFAIGGALFAVWGASRAAVGLMSALNTIFGKCETRPWWRRQLIAIGVTLGVAASLVVATSLLFVGPYIGHFVADRFGLGRTFDLVWNVGRWIGAGSITMVVWACIYKFLADTDAPFRVFTPGATVGVLAWLAISALFGLYLRHFDRYEATYGALGGAIVFLTWLWLSNIALLFGAEVNDVLADLRRDSSRAAAQLSRETEAHA